MPVSGYQVLMTWRDGNLAINEAYIWADVSADPLGVVYPQAAQLMKLRSLLMGFSVVPIRFRISKIGTFRWYLNSKPADVGTMNVGPLIVATNPTADILAGGVSKPQDGSSDQGKAAILMDAYNTPQTHARKFLAGVPDVLIRENPTGPWLIGVASWGAAFDLYRNQLIAADTRWAFKARTVSAMAPYAPQAVTRINLDVATSIISVQTTTMANPVDVGSIIQLRGFKMLSPQYQNLNGQYQIDSINAGSVGGTSLYALRRTQNIVFNQIDALGSIQLVDYTAYRFAEAYVTKETTHKRGNRGLASPGRQKRVRKITN